MRFLESQIGYAHHLVHVALGPEDAGKTDHEMITAADNGLQYGQPCRHFGGVVARLTVNGEAQAWIKIYTD